MLGKSLCGLLVLSTLVGCEAGPDAGATDPPSAEGGSEKDFGQVIINVGNVAQLHAAIDRVNQNTGTAFEIRLAAGTYFLSRPLAITGGQVTIRGSATNPLSRRISGQNLVPVLDVDSPASPAAVTIIGVTIENGFTRGTGGGIRSSSANLYVYDSIIQDNVAEGFGAGIHAQRSSGYVVIDRSLVQRNVGINARNGDCGGGFFTNGGGILLSNIGEAYIFDSSIVDNRHCRWGGVASVNSNTVIIQSTIARNEGVEHGGGVVARGSGSMWLHFNTIAENKTNTRSGGSSPPRIGAGFYAFGFSGHLVFTGNIFANNLNHRTVPDTSNAFGEDFTFEPQVPGFSFKAGLNNIRSWTMSASADSMGIPDGYVGTNPELNFLTSNGSGDGRHIMPTYMVSFTSPILRGYSWDPNEFDTHPWTVDQRGFPRPVHLGLVTLGATEPQ